MRANIGIKTPGICALAILILIPLLLRAENVKEYYQDKAGGLRQVELTEIKPGDFPKPSYELGDDESYGNYRVCTSTIQKRARAISKYCEMGNGYTNERGLSSE